MQFQSDVKESLYRVLKESSIGSAGIDIFLYTRGGDTNSVLPIVSLLREYDADFQVLVPFRAHSAGTLFALAASRIVMTRLGELSPIDPSTGNQFNPIDPTNNGNRLGISVEDVNAFLEFGREKAQTGNNGSDNSNEKQMLLQAFLERLTSEIHPLALGNVHRVHKLIRRLAERLLQLHHPSGSDERLQLIDKLTIEPNSHLHMFSREEAQQMLGSGFVEFADEELESALDSLLRAYEDDFALRSVLYISRLMNPTAPSMDFRFISGIVESGDWGYLNETKGKIYQTSKLPPNVTVQLPPGQSMPLIPGLPRDFRIEIEEQRWTHNTSPKGVTI
jgi:hypothetical protein